MSANCEPFSRRETWSHIALKRLAFSESLFAHLSSSKTPLDSLVSLFLDFHVIIWFIWNFSFEDIFTLLVISLPACFPRRARTQMSLKFAHVDDFFFAFHIVCGRDMSKDAIFFFGNDCSWCTHNHAHALFIRRRTCCCMLIKKCKLNSSFRELLNRIFLSLTSICYWLLISGDLFLK